MVSQSSRKDELLQITGSVSGIIYQNAENGYTVMEIDTEDELITAVCELPGVTKVEELRLFGNYVTHATYGTQFRVETYDRLLPASVGAIRKYLTAGAIKGIGPVLAGRIVDEFGKDSLEIIEKEPQKLTSVKGITPKKANEIATGVSEDKQKSDTEDEFIDRSAFNKRFNTEADQKWADEISYKRNKTNDKTEVKKDDESKTGFITVKTGDKYKMAEEDQNKVVDAGEDKRKLIDEVGGILKGKVDDEIIRTVMKKMEEASYNGSETSKGDDEGEEKPKEEVKDGEEEKEDTEDATKGCMDAKEITKNALKLFKNMNNFGKELKQAGVSFSFDNMESVEEMADEACKRLKLDSYGNSYSAVKAYLKASSNVRFSLDARETQSVSNKVVATDVMAKIFKQ